MSNAIIRDFKFTRDFRSIDWGATLKHCLLRAFCAGIVWSIVGLMGPGIRGHGGTMDISFLLGLPLILPIVYLVFFLPLGLLAAKLSAAVPFVGWLAIISAVLIVVGDPLVCILSLFAPKLVPMHKPGLFMFVLIIWLLKGEEVDVDVAVSDQRKINRL